MRNVALLVAAVRAFYPPPRRPRARASQNSRRAIPASAEIRATDYMGSTQVSSVGVCTMTLGLFQMTI